MNELYFLNYNFWDTFAVPEASAPLENCDVDNDFCPFMFLYSFSFFIFFFKLKPWKGNILAFFFLQSFCITHTAWLRVSSGLRQFCSCSVRVGSTLGQWKGWWVGSQCFPCTAPVQLVQINLLSCPAVKAWWSWQSWNHQDATEIALN